MMNNAIEYERIIFNKNINFSFYLYCLKSDLKLIRFFFLNILNLLISVILTTKKDMYEKNKFKYLKYVKNLESKIDKYYSNKKFNKYYDLKSNIIISKTPKILIYKDYKDKTICYDLNEKFEVLLKEFEDNISKIKDIDNLYTTSFSIIKKVKAKRKYFVRNSLMFNIRKTYSIPNYMKTILSLIILPLFLTCISFTFAITVLDFSFLAIYYEIRLFFMNFIPIFIIMLLIYIISKRVHISYLITSILLFILGIANQTKLLYRDDIVKFEDILLIKEAKIMAERYDILIKSSTIFFAIIILILFFIVKKYVKKTNFKWYTQVAISITICVLSIVGYNKLYLNQEIYNSLGNTSNINIWIETRQYQIRGLVYPFVYTIKDIIDDSPENYNETETKKILSEYKYENIPEDKKVNIIAIMLEAYNDFSKFDKINFNEDIYKKFHQIQDKSISGTLVTTVFGGGTINTERNFLTGYYKFPNYRKNTNSYVWYFKEQGYRTEANHPIYGAFYNRQSSNINLGFDVYYNYENRYSKMQEAFVNDHIFFQDIIDGYEKAKANNTPYFNFSVTYQNHGPYSAKNYETKPYYFDNENMSEEGYNIINQYFKGIKDTNDALYDLINYFEKEDEPTIIILFGDHNPFLGENNLAYNELGIDIDVSNINGFLNYYETPYIIYGNNGAKETFNKSFEGKGNTISPLFLMNELFNYIELKGNEYLQYMNNIKTEIDVISPIYLKIKDEYLINDYTNTKIKEYELVNYYVSRNFKTKLKSN